MAGLGCQAKNEVATQRRAQPRILPERVESHRRETRNSVGHARVGMHERTAQDLDVAAGKKPAA
jgi:hypothetical protein